MPDHIASADPDTLFTWSQDQEFDAYRTMLLIRRFEEKAAQLYALGEIAELPPLSIGQEAVATGLALAALPAESIVAGSRPHGLLLARGMAPDQLMARVLSARSGHSIQNNSSDGAQAAVMCISEGRSDQDALYELIERSAKTGRGIVFVIENTSDATATGVCTAKISGLGRRCEAAGLQISKVNGLDVRHVKLAMERALGRARTGGGGSIIEIMTYRYRGHAAMTGTTAPARRPREETDPVAIARTRIARMGDSVTVQRLKEIEQAVRTSVNKALSAARAISNAA